jgi:hypothetical protein
VTIEEFINQYDPKVQDIFLQVRKLALELLPDAEEILYEGWKNVSYGTGESRSDKDLIIYIAPFKDSVNLGFFRGAILSDKNRLLKGSGALLRHLKIKQIADIDQVAIKELILEAKNERLGTK